MTIPTYQHGEVDDSGEAETVCAVCRERLAELVSRGPMIWNEGGRGLYRPEKAVCGECAKLPTETLWPVTHPNDSRRVARRP